MIKKLLIATVTVFIGTGFALPSVGQSVDDVLAKHYEAIGGLEAWTELESMVASGTISLAGGMAQGPFRAHQKRPSMTRIEITIQGMNIVQAYDGQTAWQIMPMAGSTEPVEADPATTASLMEQADMDGPLIGWREDGHSIEVVGTEMVDGIEAIHLTVVVRGDTSQFYLDANTYLPIQIKTVTEGMNTTTIMSDYRNVDGLLFPFSVEIDTQMGAQALIFDEVQINVPVDDQIFSMNP
jgi:hypothetical protein